MRLQAFLIIAVLLLVSCRPGRFVDNSSPSFVDSNSAGSIDSGLPVTQPNSTGNPVINQTGSGYVAPPVNDTNSSIPMSEKQMFNRSVVMVWVWNNQGSSQLLVPEGFTTTAPNIKVSVTNVLVGTSDGVVKVKLLVNGVATKDLASREETKIGDTWVFVQDIYANEPI